MSPHRCSNAQTTNLRTFRRALMYGCQGSCEFDLEQRKCVCACVRACECWICVCEGEGAACAGWKVRGIVATARRGRRGMRGEREGGGGKGPSEATDARRNDDTKVV